MNHYQKNIKITPQKYAKLPIPPNISPIFHPFTPQSPQNHPKILPKSSQTHLKSTPTPQKSPPPINLPPSPPSKLRERPPSAAPHLCPLGPSPSMAVLRVPLRVSPFGVPVSSRLWLPRVPVAAIYGCILPPLVPVAAKLGCPHLSPHL